MRVEIFIVGLEIIEAMVVELTLILVVVHSVTERRVNII